MTNVVPRKEPLAVQGDRSADDLDPGLPASGEGVLDLLTLGQQLTEANAAFFDAQSFDVWYRYSVSQRLWLRLGAEVESWDFDPAEDDRDADGEYFQIYTGNIAGWLFFEVVQRRDYSGFGASNAPIRLAAQTRAAPRRDMPRVRR